MQSESGIVKTDKPTTLNFEIGGFKCDSHRLEGDGKQLVYTPGHSSRFAAHDALTFHPSPVVWRNFWQRCDDMAIWNWKGSYSNIEVDDGTQWELELTHSGKRRKSSGSNDTLDNPERETAMSAWIKALNILLRVSQRQCPYCSSSGAVPILIGYFHPDEKLRADIEAKRVFIGGCDVYEGMPDRHCNQCEAQWLSVKL
jgi:hypothetical protein